MESLLKKSGHIPALVAVSKKAGKAIVDYKMISAGDRIAVAVSGGKDSISLLHVLRDRQRISPAKFEFTAVHVDFEFPDFNPRGLIHYFQEHQFPYLVEKADSLKGEQYRDIDCFRWSRSRRKALFILADKMGFNKIAFGHQMDDIVQTIILNQFYRAEISAMRPKQELFDGKIVIIRPLALVREREMEYLAKKLDIASIGGQSKCADEDTSHRMIVKKMLREMEKHNRDIVKNIFSSLQNIKTDYLLNPAN